MQSRLWPRGLMEKASDYGAKECKFESCRGLYLFFIFLKFNCFACLKQELKIELKYEFVYNMLV